MKLKDICIIQSGGTPSRSKKEYWENGTIPWVKISDFSAKHIINTQESITEQGMNCSSAKLFPKGTLLYTIFATIGEVGILDIDATTNQAIVGIMIKNSMVDQEYLYYYLMSLKDYVNRIGRGVAQNNINMSILRELEIPLPPIEKQKKISNIFIQLDKMIEQRQNQIDLIDELVKSRFIELFGDPVSNPLKWDMKSLLKMGYCKNGMNFHTGDSGIEVHCLGVGDFKDYAIIDRTENLPMISLKEMPSNENMLQDGDIVFVRSNGNKALVGRCVIVYPHNILTTYSGFCIRYRLTGDEVIGIYLLQVLKTDSMRKKMAGRGANIQNLNQQILASLNIPLPPIELQNQFADFVAHVDKSKYYNFTSYKYCVVAANLIRQEWMLCQTLSF